MRQSIRFLRRGRVVEIGGLDPRTTLLDYLRLSERSVGTKEGCAEGDCGACTVVLGRLRGGRLSYEPVNACILLLGQLDGAEMVTIEDLASAEGLHPVQEAMVARHGSQCGFCTPGIVMSLFALYHGDRPVSRDDVNDALAGNLCRCTGYRPIVEAALEACAAPPQDAFIARRATTEAALAALDDGEDVLSEEGDGFFASPASEAALAEMYEAHPDATLVAGCTDVGLWLTKDLARLDKTIWLGRVQGLDSIDEGPEALSLGATVSHLHAAARARSARSRSRRADAALRRRAGPRRRARSAATSPTARRSATSRRPSSRSERRSSCARASASAASRLRISSSPIASRTAPAASSSAASSCENRSPALRSAASRSRSASTRTSRR